MRDKCACGLLLIWCDVSLSSRLLRRSGALIRSPSLLMAIASCIVLGMLGINEVAFQGANRALERSIQYQNENAVASELVQYVLLADAGLNNYLVSGQASGKHAYRMAQEQAQAQLVQLRRLLDARSAHLPELLRLQTQVDQSLLDMQALLLLYEAGTADVLDIGVRHYRVRQRIHAIHLEEKQYQAAQAAQIERAHRKTAFFLRLSQLGVALVSLVALMVFFLYLHKVKAERADQLRRQQALELEQSRLEVIVQQRTSSLFALASHLQHVRDEERAALAQELHDELGALLTVAKLDVASMSAMVSQCPKEQAAHLTDKLAHMQQTLQQLFAIKRSIIDRLFPSILSHLGLNEALQQLAHQFSNASGVRVQAQLEQMALPDKMQLMVYRITQEALNNISKYAQASLVHIRLQQHGQSGPARLVIEDNGKGFDMDAIPSATYGIKGMQHRAQALGAQWHLQSSPQGTRISVEMGELPSA